MALTLTARKDERHHRSGGAEGSAASILKYIGGEASYVDCPKVLRYDDDQASVESGPLL